MGLVIRDEGVATHHAVLQVEQDGVFLTNLQLPDSVLRRQRGGATAKPTVCRGHSADWPRDVGDRAYSGDRATAALSAPAGILRLQQRLDRVLGLGELGYRAVAALLAKEVSPDEAVGARKMFRVGMFWLGITAAGYVTLTMLGVALVLP